MTPEDAIRRNNYNIRRIIRRLRKSLANLYQLMTAQTLLIESYRETNRTAPPLFKGFAHLIRRNTIDKIFLEQMNVIDSKQRKRPTRAAQPSPLLTAGKLVGGVRESIERKQLTENERMIIKTMIKQLDNEL